MTAVSPDAVDRHDVETARPLEQPVARQVVDAPSTRSRRCFTGVTASAALPNSAVARALTSTNTVVLAVARHDVDFAMPRAVAASKNCVPAALQFRRPRDLRRLFRTPVAASSWAPPDDATASQRAGTVACAQVGLSSVDEVRAPSWSRTSGRSAPLRLRSATSSSDCSTGRVSAWAFESTSGGARRSAFLPAPRTSTPRRNIAWTSALRSSTARSFVLPIAHQLDADHQALAADVADERVLVLQRAQAVHQVRADGGGVGHERLLRAA